MATMKRKHLRTLAQLYARPTSANIKWADIEALLVALGALVEEREGSRVAIRLFDQSKVFHRPHPAPTTKKAAVVDLRKWLAENGVTP